MMPFNQQKNEKDAEGRAENKKLIFTIFLFFFLSLCSLQSAARHIEFSKRNWSDDKPNVHE